MASYELQPFKRFDAIHLVSAIEQQNTIINVGFWVRDPMQLIEWPESTQHKLLRADFLWENSCFEIFIGVKNEDFYREINLSPSETWQSYQFEEYRYPENVPPILATDIELIELKRTHYGLNAVLDLQLFLTTHQLQVSDIYIGLAAIFKTAQGTQYYAIQHSSPEPDFHNKRDWLHEF